MKSFITEAVREGLRLGLSPEEIATGLFEYLAPEDGGKCPVLTCGHNEENKCGSRYAYERCGVKKWYEDGEECGI